MTGTPGSPSPQRPIDEVESALIDQYILDRNHDPQQLRVQAAQGDQAARQVLVDASRHASGQLATISSRRRWRLDIAGS